MNTGCIALWERTYSLWSEHNCWMG